jgi:energy-coupling factor transporter ATP-binding protein EcfA2
MTFYLKNGNTYRPANEESLDLHKTLPAGNYIIQEDMHGNLFLEKIDSFTVSGKIYGNTLRYTDRILNTFNSRIATTGVMLAGEKGSGKSLLAKNVSVVAAERFSMPTIVINSAYFGDKFNKFIQSISQPCVILFDEFEKVYSHDEQEHILTLLDGVFPSKKLFMLTCNDKYRVDQNMRNRPGRIFYFIEFAGLDEDFIREYCADRLIDHSHTDAVCKVASLFSQFNFDMLVAMVEEINRYGETPQEVMKLLNAKPENDGGGSYDVELHVGGKKVTEIDTEWHGQPMHCNIISIAYESEKVDEDSDAELEECVFGINDLSEIRDRAGVFVYTKNNGDRLVMSKRKHNEVNFYDLL